ncbi:MAG: fused response regulator/phosphatase [Desulfarculus sp.]|nr:fused response regulator/phosphatase [Desulfarculus sp.]
MSPPHNSTPEAAKPSTILIVDDAKLNRELLRLHLSKHGHRFLFAENGRQATQVLAAHPEVDLILLDLVMPDMDGFAFLQWRKAQGEAQAIPVIVNSSLDDFDSIARALTMDSYDYFTKPLNPSDLEIVLPLKIKNAVSARRLMAETRRQNEVMRAELEMAARYQQFLLPRQVSLKGARVAHLFQPCSDVGGDYFDFFETAAGQLGLLAADVSGHGVAAAMTASIVKALLPGYLERMASPAAAFRALNADLLRLTQEDAFVTSVAVLYDPRAGRLTWSLAGHPSPLFIPAGAAPLPLAMDSVFLGAFENDNPLACFEESILTVQPGDRLVLYTDGLTEAPGAQGGFYGLARVQQLLERCRRQSIAELRESLWDDLNDFVRGDFPDDVAFILVEF